VSDQPKTIDEQGQVVETLPAVQEGGPSQLMSLALEQGASIEVIERLAMLYQSFEDRSARKAFFEAMAKFQAMVPPLSKDSSVDFGEGSRRVQYQHASLGAIAQAIRGSMQECGLSYRWEYEPGQGAITVSCIVTHIGGHSERTSMSAPADTSGSKNALQALGSATTYLERYTLIPALGLTTAVEDTDGREDRGGAPHQSNGAGAATRRKESATTHRGSSPAPAKSDAKVFIGTEAEPLQVNMIKKGDKVRGKVEGMSDSGWWRLEHINAGCALSKPKGSTALAPAWVRDGAQMEATVAYIGKSKTSGKPFMFLSDLVQAMDVPADCFDGKAAQNAPESPEPPAAAPEEAPKASATKGPLALTVAELNEMTENALVKACVAAGKAAGDKVYLDACEATFGLDTNGAVKSPIACHDKAKLVEFYSLVTTPEGEPF